MIGFLESVIERETYEPVIRYLSTDGQLDENKVKRLLIGNITELKAAICSIGEIREERNSEGFHSLYNNFTNRTFGKQWAEKIGVTICPYCNRSYIYTLKQASVRPQYDHYFPKSLYPYLALSMYNLIPCCAICNTAKHDYDTFDRETLEENFIYPFRDEYGQKIRFRTINHMNVNTLTGSFDHYEIGIETTEDCDENLRTREEIATSKLNLLGLYNKHKDFVKDIIFTTYIYNDDYFQNLVEAYPNLLRNAQEAENLVYMNYLDEEEWDKRVLSKLTHDIRREYQL